MVGVIIVTHCHLAEELIAAAKLVVGEELKQFQPVSIDPSEGSEVIREKILGAIRKVDEGQGVLILTDMYGGTPSNISLSFLEEKKIEVITGVNLPMLLKLATYRDHENMDLGQLASFITDYGQRNINLASEVLKKRVEKKG
jgi:PTS system mannose-specific IIA component